MNFYWGFKFFIDICRIVVILQSSAELQFRFKDSFLSIFLFAELEFRATFYTIIYLKYWGVSLQQSYKINRTKLYSMIGVALVVVIGIAAIMNKRKGNVKDIVVNIQHLQDGENDLIKDKDIKEILRRGFEENVAEMKVSRVDVQRAERILEQDPFIENAEAFVDAANDLQVVITQREPMCRIIDNNGLNYYLDKNGIKMPPSKYFSARVPIVTGSVPPHVPDFLQRKKYVLKDVYDLIQYIQKDAFYKTFFQQIHVDPGGEFTLIPVLGDQKIRIGTLDNLEDKLSRLKIFYEEAMPYEGWKKYSSISVKYKGQIVCKKR